MIDDEKIEEAASIYGTSNGYSVIGPDGRMSLKPELETAFETGAHWVIEQLLNRWHHKSEIPDGKILYIDDFNFPYGMEWFRDIHYDEDQDALCPRKSIINTNFILYAQCYENYVEVTINDGSKFLIKKDLDDFLIG